MKKVILYSCILFTFLTVAGCATTPIVQPTYEEMRAARAQKQTLAIVEFGDKDSPIRDVQDIALSRLENILIDHFNLVERMKINSVMAERTFHADDIEGLARIGKILGADYVVVGNATASVSGPHMGHSDYRKDGNFYGSIWQETTATCTVSIKMIDVGNGIVSYSNVKKGIAARKSGTKKYSNEDQYRDDVKNEMILRGVVEVAKIFSGMEDRDSELISEALTRAVTGFKNDIRQRYSHRGEILQILSDYEVLINLGSAYGIRPGDVLIAWEEMPPVEDPKTGIITVPKQKLGTLNVMKVTSGLTCIARGSRGVVQCLQVGDEVETLR